MKKKMKITLLALLIALGTWGCDAGKAGESTAPPPVTPSANRLSTWAVYWDSEDILESVSALQGRLESLHYFAAYFDANDQLFLPDETERMRTAMAKAYGTAPSWSSYLTIVNDQMLAEGGSSLKDTQLLYRLLGTENARRQHISDLLALAKDGGYNGIEIDYEAIRNDSVLWQHMLAFVQELYQQTEAEGLRLRVVLEPGIPYDTLSFPAGPDYAVMCYNLYGTGTAPGPKADDAFLRSLLKKTEHLPGKRTFAVATGGFDWANGTATAVSEQQAATLADKMGAAPVRDAASQALSFSYQQDGTTHTVWYADSTTLNHWMTVLQSEGEVGLAVWRLGGSDPSHWLQ